MSYSLHTYQHEPITEQGSTLHP